MASLTASGLDELGALLQDAVLNCSDRCLYQAAKWAAELLTSLASPPTPDPASPADTEPNSPIDTRPAAYRSTRTAGESGDAGADVADAHAARLERAELPRYLLAKTLFDCREYDRAAAVFLPIALPVLPSLELRTADNQTPKSKKGEKPSTKQTTVDGKPEGRSLAYSTLSEKALFLALYARYLAGEKRKDEDSEMILGPADGGATVNRELNGIAGILKARLEWQDTANVSGRGWLEYLYGVVLAKGKNYDAAREWFIKSVQLYPYNWSAWVELNSLIGTLEELHHVMTQLPQNIMSFIFQIYANQELIQFSDVLLRQLKQLKAIFPTSLFLKTQKALMYHHYKDFDKAERVFSKVIQADPQRLDNLDAYSNCLYVMDKRPRLAFLAQLTMATDKFRPETCCVVGNYYSMKSEHEKAVVYFRRALTLDRNFLAAWTLMGHEYIEMKNTHAAIESYRRAVDVNRKDYRAWYGLGQTYEILDMHFYALFYYQRAAALSPGDPKMWMAVGSCLAKMERPSQAVKAFKRSLLAGSNYEATPGNSFGSGSLRSSIATTGGAPQPAQRGHMDPEALFQVASQYARLGDMDQTKAYLELVLEQEDGGYYARGRPGDGDGLSDDEEYWVERGGGGGVGVTATTSKARMWLARLENARGGRGGLRRAMRLAQELCDDGVEVEEAKALVRDIRARMYDEGELSEVSTP